MNIVTGYTGTPHITANEAQALNQGILGSGNYVLDVGQKFSATIVDANNITIEDGEGVMQGVQFRIAPGETENVSISNGTTGYNRIDLICARYTKDPQTGIEAVNLVVIEGEPSSSDPTEPDYNTGDILTNDSPVDFPLYKVTLTGLTPAITPITAPESRIVTPPDFMRLSTAWSSAGTDVFQQEITADKDGWYALCVTTTSGQTWAEGDVYIYKNELWYTIAAVSDHASMNMEIMTPWLFFKSGSTFKVAGNGSRVLYFAPCM